MKGGRKGEMEEGGMEERWREGGGGIREIVDTNCFQHIHHEAGRKQ